MSPVIICHQCMHITNRKVAVKETSNSDISDHL